MHLSVISFLFAAFFVAVCSADEAPAPPAGQGPVPLIVVADNATYSDGQYRYSVPVGQILMAERARDGVHWVPDSKVWIAQQFVEPLCVAAIQKCRKNGAPEPVCIRAQVTHAALECQRCEKAAKDAAQQSVAAMRAAELARKLAEASAAKAETAGAKAETAGAKAETAGAKAETSAAKAETSAAKAETSAAKAETSAAKAETAAAKAQTAARVAAVMAGEAKEFAHNARQVYEAMARLRATNLSFQPAKLQARIRVRVVDGVPKCELFEFSPKPPPELIIINSKVQPKTLRPQTRAMFTMRVFEKVDGGSRRCLGEAMLDDDIVFDGAAANRAGSKVPDCPFSCGIGVDQSHAKIKFRDRFEDLSGKIELILKCDARVKKQDVHQVELRGYVQFELPKRGGGESGVLGPIEEVENGITLSIQYEP